MENEMPLLSRFSDGDPRRLRDGRKVPQLVANFHEPKAGDALNIDVIRCRYTGFVEANEHNLPIFKQWVKLGRFQKGRAFVHYLAPAALGHPDAPVHSSSSSTAPPPVGSPAGESAGSPAVAGQAVGHPAEAGAPDDASLYVEETLPDVLLDDGPPEEVAVDDTVRK